MNPADLPRAALGIEHACPRCTAGPGQPCVGLYGRVRATTHQERKPKAENE